MSAPKVDVLAVMDGERRMLAKLQSLAEWSECANVEKGEAILREHDSARAAVAELIEALRKEDEWSRREAEGAIDPEWDYESMVGQYRRAALARIGGAA